MVVRKPRTQHVGRSSYLRALDRMSYGASVWIRVADWGSGELYAG
jgi:hypothetical protein